MVKILILLSLLAIVSATTPHGLSEIANVATQVIIDAGVYADTSTGPTLLTLTYPTTYDCSVTNPSVFTIAGTATYAGNNTVAGGAITFTSGTNSVVIPFEATVTGLTTATLDADAYPVFRVGGTYTATVQLFTSTFHVYPVTLVTGNLASVAVTAYAGPALSALSIVSPQNGGCDNLGCTLPINGSATLNPGRVSTQLKVYFRSPAAATAVKFQITSSVTGAGASDFNTQSNPIYAVLGGIQDGAFVANSQTAATSTVIPQGLPLAISGQAQESGYRFTYFNEATVGALQASVTFTGGSTDVTAPTCSVATVSPLTLSTNVPALYPLTITLTCADEQGGSGLWTKGYIAVAKVSSNGATTTPPFVQTFSTATSTFYVPPYVSGSFNIIGVFAIDNAGNGALYGDCGGAVGYDTLCAGISSASTMTISLFSVVVLAFFVLCA